MKKSIFIFLLFLTTLGTAKMKTEYVNYNDGNVKLQGYLVYDDSSANKRPGILIVHEWWGLNDYPKKRAEQIAALGYVAFAADMYGEGKNTTKMEEAKTLAGTFYSDPQMTRRRITEALDVLKKNKFVDTKNIAAVGYCFGGMVALELAESGADIKGVAAFHPGLPKITDADKIKAKVLVMIGADDKAVSDDAKKAFMNALDKAKVDWQMNLYSGTVHAFTNPAAGNDPSKGMAYNERADKRSWEEMKNFFQEIFGEK